MQCFGGFSILHPGRHRYKCLQFEGLQTPLTHIDHNVGVYNLLLLPRLTSEVPVDKINRTQLSLKFVYSHVPRNTGKAEMQFQSCNSRYPGIQDTGHFLKKIRTFSNSWYTSYHTWLKEDTKMMIYDTVQLKRTLNEQKTSLNLFLCLVLLQNSPNA